MSRLIFSLFISTAVSFATVTVDGYAYLGKQNDHSGINIIFDPRDTGPVTNIATTDANGYFTVQVETKNYFITYAKDGYFSEPIKPYGAIDFDIDTTLSSVTLIKQTKLIEFVNFIENIVVDNYRKLDIPQKLLERIQLADTTSQTTPTRHHQPTTSQSPASEPAMRFSKNVVPSGTPEKSEASDQSPASHLATRFSKNAALSGTPGKTGASDLPAITTRHRSARKLPAKTKMGAMVRSLLFPGLGQFYADQRMWGYGWIAAEVVAGGLIFMNYSNYKTANDDYNDYHTSYANATDPTLIAQYKTQAQNSHENVESASDAMKTMAGIAGVVWIANVVHAYMVGPKSEVTAYNEIPLQMAYDQNTDQFKLSISISLD